MSDEGFVPVASLASLPEGRMQAVEVGSREILLCRVQGGVYAVDNVCTHAFARMSEGRLRGARLICPLHGASFDVRTGKVLGAPATRPLASHRVRIVGDSIEVAPASHDPSQLP